MKKYTAPCAKSIHLYEESEIMLSTQSGVYADEAYSNRRDEEDYRRPSIWE